MAGYKFVCNWITVGSLAPSKAVLSLSDTSVTVTFAPVTPVTVAVFVILPVVMSAWVMV